jgi:hypothetical protein
VIVKNWLKSVKSHADSVKTETLETLKKQEKFDKKDFTKNP